MINGDLTWVCLKVLQWVCKPTVYSFLQFWGRHTQKLAESPCWFPNLWSKGHYDRKGQVETTRIALPRKIVSQKQYHTHGGIAEISAIIRHLMEAGEVIPTTSPFNSPIWLLQKMYLVRMTVDYHKFNQVLTPIANLSDFISLLEQINTSPGMWYAAVD